MEVRISPHLEPGKAVLVKSWTGLDALFCRHESELLLLVAGATWHPDGGHCPTWTDSECSCMLGGEA